MIIRHWTCGCGHEFNAEVKHAAHTANLSGEATVYCPKCWKRPMIGSPHITTPYPFCHTPALCAGKGYCPHDIACNN